MGRKQQAKRMAETTQPKAASSNTFAGHLLRLPRLIRILLIAIPALAAVTVFTPVVDGIYLRYFYTFETRIIPSIITSAIGLVTYLLGWVLVVGTVGEIPEEGLRLNWYLRVSLVMTLVGLTWLGILIFQL